MHCGAIELLVGPGARLRYVNLQHWSTKVWHFAHQKGLVDRGGQLQWTIAALGSRLAKVNQHVALVGQDANVQVNGVMFTEGKQHLSYHTLQHHQAPSCKSDLLYKAALQDASRTVWRGMIKVDRRRAEDRRLSAQRQPDALGSCPLRLDPGPGDPGRRRALHARLDDRPGGRRAGFYARCRGLTRKEAIRMIVAGFFQQVFDRITIESVREALGKAIGRRIREYD